MINIALTVMSLCTAVTAISGIKLYHSDQYDPVVLRTLFSFSWTGATVFGPILIYIDIASSDLLTTWIISAAIIATSVAVLSLITEGMVQSKREKKYRTHTNNF